MNAADACTPESHENDKRSRASNLVYKGEQLDENGCVDLVYLHCSRCQSTLAEAPAICASARAA